MKAKREPKAPRSATSGGQEPEDISGPTRTDSPNPLSDTSMPHVAIVDDEPMVLSSLAKMLSRAGYRVSSHGSAEEVLAAIHDGAIIDLLLSDLRMPGTDGVELLKKFKALCPDTPVLMLTGAPDAATAVEAMNYGAAHYLIKPVKNKELQLVVHRTLEAARTRAENRRLRMELFESTSQRPPMLWKSVTMRRVVEQISRLADLDATVLITGENGTGKELLAHHLHLLSERARSPFVPVNCGAIPRDLLESELFGHRKGAFTGAVTDNAGLFEEARGGTLFLDEVGDLPLGMQVKLLHALDTHQVRAVGDVKSRKVDLRIIAATNRNLEKDVSEGNFRQDLYFRLNVFRICLPPLRERQEDICLLARHFLKDSAARFNRPVRDFTPAALEVLMSHHWAGNVRELSNAIQRAVILCGAGLVDAVHLQLDGATPGLAAGGETMVAEEMIPDDLNLKAALERSREKIEKRYILEALKQTDGNRTRAAHLLGISYRALLYKLKNFDI